MKDRLLTSDFLPTKIIGSELIPQTDSVLIISDHPRLRYLPAPLIGLNHRRPDLSMVVDAALEPFVKSLGLNPIGVDTRKRDRIDDYRRSAIIRRVGLKLGGRYLEDNSQTGKGVVSAVMEKLENGNAVLFTPQGGSKIGRRCKEDWLPGIGGVIGKLFEIKPQTKIALVAMPWSLVEKAQVFSIKQVSELSEDILISGQSSSMITDQLRKVFYHLHPFSDNI